MTLLSDFGDEAERTILEPGLKVDVDISDSTTVKRSELEKVLLLRDPVLMAIGDCVWDRFEVSLELKSELGPLEVEIRSKLLISVKAVGVLLALLDSWSMMLVESPMEGNKPDRLYSIADVLLPCVSTDEVYH